MKTSDALRTLPFMVDKAPLNSDDPSDAVSAFAEAEFRKNLASWVYTSYEKARNDSASIRNQWYINLAFYKGDQYVQMIRGTLIKTPPISGRVRLVINRIRGTVRTEISRMTSQKPSATVLPASADDDDILAAEAGEATWEFLSESKKIQGRLIDAAFWVANCGIGYIKIEWDKDAEVRNGGENGETVRGDIRYTAPTPFHIYVADVMERDIEDQPFVIHTFTMSLEKVRARWGDLIPEDKVPSVRSTNDILESQYLNTGNSQNEAKPDSCLVMEAWVKPGATPLLPKGGRVVVIDNDCVVEIDRDGIPFEHGQYPFAKIDNVPSGGYFSTSPIEDLIPLQKELNRNRSTQVETRNFAGRPAYTAQEGSIDTNKWSTKPGQVILFKPGFQAPQPLQLPQLPQHISGEHENLLRDIEDISGQHQVSKGTAPSGVTAATAISFLQEQDESYMYTVYYSIEQAMQKVAHQSLMNCVQYWDEPRLIRSVGTDQPFSAQLLKRADLSSGTDIRMDTGSALPVSKSARNAMFMDMMNRGLIPADKGLEMMELPNMRKYWDIIKKDEKQATRENLRLRQSDPAEIAEAQEIALQQKNDFLAQYEMDEDTARTVPQIAQVLDQFDRPMLPVNDWDNHEVHIFVHQGFMKTQAFEVLDEGIRQEFIKHVDAHKAILQSTQLNTLMQGGTSGGDDMQEEMAALMGGGMPGQGMPGQEGQPPAEGNNAEGANQFSGIEEPVDGNIV